jgi:hypothetical protein
MRIASDRTEPADAAPGTITVSDAAAQKTGQNLASRLREGIDPYSPDV